MRLWARVQLWRVQYRLSALSARSTGSGGVEFRARINPSQSVGNGYLPAGMALRNMVNRAVERILAREDVRAAGATIATEAAAGREVHIRGETLGYTGYAAALRHPSMPVRPRFSAETVRVGQGAHPVRVHRLGAFDPREGVVRGGGRYVNAPERLAASRAGRHAGRFSPAAVHELATTGQLPHRYRHAAETLAPITHTMYGAETRRRPQSLAYAAMTTELATRGRGSIPDLPQAPRGAGVAARFEGSTRAEREQIWRGRSRAERRQLVADVRAVRRREIAIAERWLQARLAAGEYFRDETHAENWIYEQLLERLRIVEQTTVRPLAGTGRPGEVGGGA